jgi:hypothetical protein
VRALRRLVVVLTIVAVTWPLGFASPAEACTCPAIHRPEDVVFDGVAERFDGSTASADRWVFDVTWTYRGTIAAQRTVHLSTGQSSTCGFDRVPVVGTKYRIGAVSSDGELYANWCWGSFVELGPTRAADNFVASAFDDLTWRPPTGERFRHWTSALEAGAPRAALVDAILRSRAYAETRLTSLYRSILGRSPSDAAGRLLAHHLSQGGREEDIRNALLASDEHLWRLGSTAAFVNALYSRLLGRSADAAGRSFWIDQLDSGRPAIVVVAALASSLEAQRQTVYRSYRSLLGRPPTGVELEAGIDSMEVGGKLQLVRELTRGSEYLQRATASAG